MSYLPVLLDKGATCGGNILKSGGMSQSFKDAEGGTGPGTEVPMTGKKWYLKK